MTKSRASRSAEEWVELVQAAYARGHDAGMLFAVNVARDEAILGIDCDKDLFNPVQEKFVRLSKLEDLLEDK
jgi:hypothetical protein